MVLAAAGAVNSIGFLEFLQGLGATANGVPALLWQLDQARDHQALGYQRAPFYQDEWANVDYKKPTGILTNAPRLAEEANIHMGWPKETVGHRYLGPLPVRSTRRGTLIRNDSVGKFKSGSSAAYPAEICMRFAHLLFRTWVDQVLQN